MDNEILGYVIINVYKVTVTQDNNRYASGKIILKKIDNQYIEPDKREFGEYYEAYVVK